MAQNYTYKICSKCGKRFFAGHNVCPNCKPKTSILMSSIIVVKEVVKLMGK